MIGLLGCQYERPGGTPLAGIGERYLRAIEAAGGTPVIVQLTRDAAVLDWLYRQVDALLFAGGGDIDPVHFGHAQHPQLGEIEPLRDEVELALARRAAADGKPMLGICRGIQVLNVAQGGTLYQDIGAELPGSLEHRECSLRGDRTYLAHPVALDPGSWLAAQLDAVEIEANTMHHQALRDIAPGLRVVGHAPDGVVEAVEGVGRSFVVGVQCHPEELWNGTEPRWAHLFQGFVSVAGATGDRVTG